MNKLIGEKYSNKTFEDIKHIDEKRVEFLYAKGRKVYLNCNNKIKFGKENIMNFKTNKEKGNTSLGIAIAYYASNGYIVSIPLNDTQDYDLIVDKDNILKRIQVKSTACKTKYGNYQVALKSCGGTKGKTYKTVIETNVDELFLLTEDMNMYIIPIESIKNKATLNICEKYQRYKINFNI